MKKYISVSALAAGLSLAAAIPAFALTVDANMTGSASTNATYSGVASSGSSASSSTSGSAGLSAGVNVTGGSITASSQVKSDSDLDAYLMSVQQNDTSVNAVSIDDTSVSVDYKVPAKLFGFISVNMTETASVEVDSANNTEVYVSRPWWSFMAKAEDHTDAFAAHIKSHLPQPSSASATADAKLTAAEKAQLISAIQAGARETFSASSAASSDTSASASGAGSVQY